MAETAFVTHHVVFRMMERVPEYSLDWDPEQLWQILNAAIVDSIPVGATCGDGLAWSVRFPHSDVAYYLVGKLRPGIGPVITSLLTEAMFQANLQQNGLHIVKPPRKHRKFNHGRRRVLDAKLKNERPWKVDKHAREKKLPPLKPKRQRGERDDD
jgi:hypothetical protein